jgi:hypothetical protein
VVECSGITDRAVHGIVTQVVRAGYLSRHRLGRRNFYEIHAELPLRHPLDHDHQIGELLRDLLPDGPRPQPGALSPSDS